MVSADALRRPIERLARIDRASCSPGEFEAAVWIADALEERGASAEIECETVHGTYWWPLGATSSLGIAAAVAGRSGLRRLGFATSAAATALVVDELSAGARWLRRMLPKQRTTNVLAQAGDANADDTVILVAHHDAAHSGFFFNPRIGQIFSRLMDRGSDQPPSIPGLMLPIALGPAMAGLGAAVGARRLAAVGGLLCGGIVASFVDTALRDTVPGANDNLTGVTTLLAVAEALKEQPVDGVSVLLVSTGAEESLMEGMRAFARRHFPRLAPERTKIICVDCVGSPHLVLAEAEGMLRVRQYDPALKDLLAQCASANGIELLRGMTMRFGTDGYLALRHGYPAAMLMSVDASGAASNYHWPTDTPDRVNYRTVRAATTLCEQAIRRLARAPAPEQRVSC